MAKRSFFKSYGFIIFMLLGIIGGCVVGALNPVVKDASGEVISKGATVLEPLGTVFINLMFCVVVPMVFCSISSAIANMSSAKRAGKVMGVTVATFFVTAAIAAVIMYIVVRVIPITSGTYEVTEGEVGATLGVADMIINFFTKPDFAELWSRRAILPLIVAAVFFGFGIQMAGGKETLTAKILDDLTNCIMKVIKIITYYAPVGFFGFFAYLVATYGPDLIGDYSRTLIVYYVLCFVYMFVFFPIYARFGGGKGGAKVMWKHLFRPAAVSFGTCSSVATIPTNMEVAEETGISKEVTNIVLPMGATMHMDGSAMSAIIKVAFLFGIFGMDFGTSQAILAIIVAVFSSVAMSGIPGGGGTGELVLCTIFFPDQLAIAFPIALALGNLVDPPATMVNAAGDYVASFIVERYVNGKDWLQKKLAKKSEPNTTEA
ncbi:MAG: dicarboxylate/amino acid:cation symporter [Oscillospiraceae bacterium]